MPLISKTFSDLFNSVVGKFRKELPSIDPTIQSSLARAVTAGSAASGVALQEGIQDAVNQAFWQTADDDFLELIGGYDGVIRFDPQIASGQSIATGTLSTLIPSGTALTANGNSYTTIQDAFVINYQGTITLSETSTTVTATTALNHSLATGQTVTISNAVQGAYNGPYVITVLSLTTFSYTIVSTGLTSDSGNYSTNYALLTLNSVLTGNNQNLISGATLSINITNIDSTSLVTFSGVQGGSDQEDINAYRDRVGQAHSLTPGISTPDMIIYSAKQISGNTRVFVIRPVVDINGNITIGGTQGLAGYYPQAGETVVYVLRDNDSSIIPSNTILTNTKNQILTDGCWPTYLPDSFIYVIAPSLQTQAFSIASLVPNTITMQNTIKAQLPLLFQDLGNIGPSTISLVDIESFLNQIQDNVTGESIKSYTLTTPSADITLTMGQIYTSGTVTFT